ncbi:SDR family NAD(P)-dependent oxidoreductase [Marinomonas pollencensis]|uniref:Short-subunit dehydrogenase n=1 Tax=Marinomonas pollencensis TaxID=491954 RepID=A0A3E0DKV4_9GAMM|nr:SDR family NAD(P)-dependent oxidoreductase [Marinomonas pollencensis]REG82396.1 short-subunit dehydrogenase [Marinomonas pollencensis]
MDETKQQPTVWITGASSGIGFALVERYLSRGYHVLASARSEGKLTTLSAHPSLRFIPYDVTDESQTDGVRGQIEQHTKHLDCVILNAGNCEYLDLQNPDWTMMARIMAVNYLGLVNSVAVSLPLLKQAQSPHLVGVSSQAVQAAFPQAEAYGSSKAAVRYFLASLRVDLRPSNIDVTCVLPGFVDTPLTQKNTFSMPFLMSSEEAALRIETALVKRPYEYAFPRRLSVMLWFARRFAKRWTVMMSPKQ